MLSIKIFLCDLPVGIINAFSGGISVFITIRPANTLLLFFPFFKTLLYLNYSNRFFFRHSVKHFRMCPFTPRGWKSSRPTVPYNTLLCVYNPSYFQAIFTTQAHTALNILIKSNK